MTYMVARLSGKEFVWKDVIGSGLDSIPNAKSWARRNTNLGQASEWMIVENEAPIFKGTFDGSKMKWEKI
ncbi:MAG: hypothetical protein ABFD82_00655 [Syntrophaceae bacterium]